MSSCATRYFGQLEYADDAALEFPDGLPGFEQERRFLVIEQPSTRPLVYLQSLADPELCFVCLPVQSIDPQYGLELTPEEVERLGLPAGSTPQLGPELLGLAIVSFSEEGASANLMAPVVAAPVTRRAVQSFGGVGRYSHRHALVAEEEAAC